MASSNDETLTSQADDNQLRDTECETQEESQTTLQEEDAITGEGAPSCASEELPVTTEDLIPLIKAIIFAYPEYDESPVRIHEEIVSVASRAEPILSTISLETVEAAFVELRQRQRLDEQQQADVLKLYTVGDASKQMTEEGGTDAAISTEQATSSASSLSTLTPVQWVNIPLDVPADRSGLKPHQALINFNADSGGGNQDTAEAKPASFLEDTFVFIVKIQVAMGGMGQNTPMLLYDSRRNLKTFIHYDEATKDSYNLIQGMIVSKGVEGALGKAGGTKGYFYAKHVAETNSSEGEKFISVNCTEMAPEQSW